MTGKESALENFKKRHLSQNREIIHKNSELTRANSDLLVKIASLRGENLEQKGQLFKLECENAKLRETVKALERAHVRRDYDEEMKDNIGKAVKILSGVWDALGGQQQSSTSSTSTTTINNSSSDAVSTPSPHSPRPSPPSPILPQPQPVHLSTSSSTSKAALPSVPSRQRRPSSNRLPAPPDLSFIAELDDGESALERLDQNQDSEPELAEEEEQENEEPRYAPFASTSTSPDPSTVTNRRPPRRVSGLLVDLIPPITSSPSMLVVKRGVAGSGFAGGASSKGKERDVLSERLNYMKEEENEESQGEEEDEVVELDINAIHSVPEEAEPESEGPEADEEPIEHLARLSRLPSPPPSSYAKQPYSRPTPTTPFRESQESEITPIVASKRRRRSSLDPVSLSNSGAVGGVLESDKVKERENLEVVDVEVNGPGGETGGRRARKSVNYALPKLNTKMRRPEDYVPVTSHNKPRSSAAASSASSSAVITASTSLSDKEKDREKNSKDRRHTLSS